MAALAWYEWLIRIAGAMIIALGIGMAIWSLRGDRSRGRRRCPKCWYDMSAAAAAPADDGTEHFTCPECGRRIVGVRGLLKTRRLWKLAACLLLLPCMGWQMCLIGTPGREGLTAFVPTVVLIAFENDFVSAMTLDRSLFRRLDRGVALPWDKFFASMRELHSTEFDWGKIVEYRARWPSGLPLTVRLGSRLEHSVFESREYQFEWVGGNGGRAAMRAGPSRGLVGTPARMTWGVGMPSPDPGSNSYNMIVSVRGEHGGVRSKRVTLHVRGVPRPEDAFIPDASPQAHSNILASVRWHVDCQSFPPTVQLLTDPRSAQQRWSTSWQGVHADLYFGQTLAGSGAIDSLSWLLSKHIIRTPKDNFAGAPFRDPIKLDTARLVLTPWVDNQVLSELDWTHCWSGTLRVRLRDLPLVDANGTPRDASGVERFPVTPDECAALIASLPLYTPREIPLLPTTGGTLEVPPNRDDQ